eukprot:CAMPEP_0197700434 /NCGR_PEP_ID=MMETSP1338-20131121/121975_1 /TAXON_ID=43686 ORGANISM="Pelagodinium beii, Strain RCC1491" /NCGR_SAMPLE_ID=MMETSP1338 /ASSEMBLY_ACC=CAM_ASM_000754 /LENGTH=51 /DNA_ID=CAMNT_0043284045 /DNA_START=44 /DNA_END=199 /DNA_ORIENTATION=-
MELTLSSTAFNVSTAARPDMVFALLRVASSLLAPRSAAATLKSKPEGMTSR